MEKSVYSERVFIVSFKYFQPFFQLLLYLISYVQSCQAMTTKD